MGEERTHEQSDKRLRVSSTYSPELFEKLDKLACACGISMTTLQTRLIALCLDREEIINEIQERHHKRSRFRVIPLREGQELRFIFAEKKRKGR
jgi:hypothetical protein